MRAIPVISAAFAASVILAMSALGCDPDPAPRAEPAANAAAAEEVDALVGYDVRLLRPGDESLSAVVERVRARALDDGKRVVMLFSADWCHRCRRLEAELGNTAPRSQIGDVQVLMMKEEDWEAATRLDEFKGLRTRWEPAVGTFPFMVLLRPDGGLAEEMKQAKLRLEAEGLEPTLANWFDTSRVSAT